METHIHTHTHTHTHTQIVAETVLLFVYVYGLDCYSLFYFLPACVSQCFSSHSWNIQQDHFLYHAIRNFSILYNYCPCLCQTSYLSWFRRAGIRPFTTWTIIDNTDVKIRKHTHMHAYRHACKCTHMPTHRDADTHTHTHTHREMQTHTYTQINTQKHVYTHTKKTTSKSANITINTSMPVRVASLFSLQDKQQVSQPPTTLPQTTGTFRGDGTKTARFAWHCTDCFSAGVMCWLRNISCRSLSSWLSLPLACTLKHVHHIPLLPENTERPEDSETGNTEKQ